MVSKNEREEIEEALKQGKLVVIRGASEIKVSIEPKDKVKVIERR